MTRIGQGITAGVAQHVSMDPERQFGALVTTRFSIEACAVAEFDAGRDSNTLLHHLRTAGPYAVVSRAMSAFRRDMVDLARGLSSFSNFVQGIVTSDNTLKIRAGVLLWNGEIVNHVLDVAFVDLAKDAVEGSVCSWIVRAGKRNGACSR
jgi:hypothetical protein